MVKMTQKYIISIIIPVLNEAAIIESTLKRLQNNPDVEIIVVDGGSSDRTVALAQKTGVTVIAISSTGRASQMNVGAALAKADYLLFLHVDTQLPTNYLKLVTDSLSQPQTVAGAFELAIAAKGISLRLVEILVKMRSHLLSLPYGDQAIFLPKKVFTAIGGFPDLPIMEDFELMQRLKRLGKIAIAPVPVITSPRRWQKLGVLQTTFINQLIIIGYYLGISPTKLRDFYRGMGNKK